MTSRRLGVLIEQLPSDSRTNTKYMEAPPYARWTAGEYLVADLIDLMKMNILATVYHQSGKKAPKITPIERPTDRLQKMREDAELAKAVADRELGIAPEWWAGMVGEAIATGKVDAAPEAIVPNK